MSEASVERHTIRIASLTILRNDAIERGNIELALTIGWSIISLQEERLRRLMEMTSALPITS